MIESYRMAYLNGLLGFCSGFFMFAIVFNGAVEEQFRYLIMVNVVFGLCNVILFAKNKTSSNLVYQTLTLLAYSHWPYFLFIYGAIQKKDSSALIMLATFAMKTVASIAVLPLLVILLKKFDNCSK